MAQITWTHFADRGAAYKRELAAEWADLVEHLNSAGPFASKAACPWIKLARFGNTRSGKGALRHDGNVLELTGVEGDYDGEQITPEDAIQRLERAGLRAIVYTSPSHTEQRPRWRVLAPLALPHTPEHRTRLLARVNGALGGILTDESFTLSQSYYYGRVEGQAYRVLSTFDDPEDGACVDQANELDAIAIAKAPRYHLTDGGRTTIAERVEQLGRRLRTGDGRRELLKSYIGDKSARGLCADEIRTLVDDMVSRFFDQADPPDWSNLNELIRDITSSDEGERTQVQATVGAFVERVTKPEPPPADLVLTIGQLHQRARAITWAVKGLIPEQGVGFVYGASQTFKSFILLDYALHRAYGMQWMGRKTKQAIPVYLAAEGGAGLMRRIEAWHQARGMDWRKCPMRVVVVALTLRTQAATLRRAIEACGIQPGDVIVDTMSQTFTGNENSNDEVAEFLRVLGTELRDGLGCTVSIVHHTGHMASERPRGASAIIANVDFAFGIFRDEAAMLAHFEVTKVKDAERIAPQAFDIGIQELGRDEDGDSITSLVASHINNADNLVAAHQRENAAGRGGREGLLLSIADVGMTEKGLRKAFYEALPSASTDTKKKAFYRARDDLIAAGLLAFGFDPEDKERRITFKKEAR